MRRYGLVGNRISYSFSKGYFTQKFTQMGIKDTVYDNFDLDDISEITVLLKNPQIKGLNVTIPYKEAVIPYIDRLHPVADEIGAVNTISFSGDQVVGHNTDALGFKLSLMPLLKDSIKKALVLGTGGASKAVLHVLEELNIRVTNVSRSGNKGDITYDDLTTQVINHHKLIVNTTPVGTFPNISLKPALPYEGLTSEHVLYDLVYNPLKTAFLEEGFNRGATISNGIRMLELQAEAAWEIWQSP